MTDPTVSLVEDLISEAVRLKASHIHLEPEENLLHVRLRIDGLLHKQSSLSKENSPAVIARLKSISGMDVSQTRAPQQGRLETSIGGSPVAFLVSTCPTLHGENIVLSAVQQTAQTFKLDALGLSGADLRRYKDLVRSGCGIMFVSGPAGSGKTATLYASLQMMRNANRSVMAVEEMIEQPLAGIHQVAVNTGEGRSFPAVLRSFLQQDPDVILVGEIREKETAEIAVQAALTGRLVFSTVHSDSASAALVRLLDIGVDPFLVSSAVLGVLAQRLIRRVCEACRQTYQPDSRLLRELELHDRQGAVRLSRGKGCPACAQTGYSGWMGVYELLAVTPGIQELMLKRADVKQIRQLAAREGMRTMRQAAMEKMLLGMTSAEEVMRLSVVQE